MARRTRQPFTGRIGNRREALQAAAAAVGGTFVPGSTSGGMAVHVSHGPWTLTLDLYAVHTGTVSLMHTRVFTDFASREDFRLRIRPRTVFDRALAKLGFGAPRHGDGSLARDHVVRGRPAPRVRSVLSGGLSAALLAVPSVTVEVIRAPRKQRKRLGPTARRLQVLAPGADVDVERSIALMEVARGAMDALGRSGVAN